MIYLLIATGFTPGGSSTVHIYKQTIHRTTQSTTQLGRVRAVPRLCELHLGTCFTTDEKAGKNLSQGSRRVPVGTRIYTIHDGDDDDDDDNNNNTT